MYVAVKGGERAIENAHALLAHARRGDPSVPEISLAQISEQLALAVDRVMSEGSLYDRRIAAPVAVIRRAAPAEFASSRGCAQLLAFGLEHVVEAILGKLDAGREPEISGPLHVLDDAA